MPQADRLPTYVSFLKQNRTREQAQAIYAQRLADARLVFDLFGSEFVSRPCPVCGHEDYTETDPFDERYRVARCDRCTALYVNPAPGSDALNYYYNECECNAQLGALLRARASSGNIILSERGALVIELIERLLATKPRLRVLEVGCNSGAFLQELSNSFAERGLTGCVTMEGIDIDENAIAHPVCEASMLMVGTAESLATGAIEPYDLILHFELIEHLVDPFGFMVAVNDLLVPGGICHFHTPNADGFDNSALGYNDFRPLAHGIFPPMHLQAFTPRNMVHFALRAGFLQESCETPGNFDVDIVRQFSGELGKEEFGWIDRFDEGQLAIVQRWLRHLRASSHMAVTLRKPA